jgi:hypothetical protein
VIGDDGRNGSGEKKRARCRFGGRLARPFEREGVLVVVDL